MKAEYVYIYFAIVGHHYIYVNVEYYIRIYIDQGERISLISLSILNTFSKQLQNINLSHVPTIYSNYFANFRRYFIRYRPFNVIVIKFWNDVNGSIEDRYLLHIIKSKF